jgi:hypothetical protein
MNMDTRSIDQRENDEGISPYGQGRLEVARERGDRLEKILTEQVETLVIANLPGRVAKLERDQRRAGMTSTEPLEKWVVPSAEQPAKVQTCKGHQEHNDEVTEKVIKEELDGWDLTISVEPLTQDQYEEMIVAVTVKVVDLWSGEGQVETVVGGLTAEQWGKVEWLLDVMERMLRKGAEDGSGLTPGTCRRWISEIQYAKEGTGDQATDEEKRLSEEAIRERGL